MSKTIEAIRDGQALGKLLRLSAELEKAQAICKIVCDHFGIKADDLTARNKADLATWPRHVAMWLMRQFTTLSFAQIAVVFDRTKGAVINAMRTVMDCRDTEPESSKALILLTENTSAAIRAINERKE